MTPSANRTAYLWAAVLLVVLGLAGLLVLILTGHDTTVFLTFLSAPLAALLVASQVYSVTSEQNAKLDTITKQTNGILDQRIADGVAAALTKLAGDATPGTHAAGPPGGPPA